MVMIVFNTNLFVSAGVGSAVVVLDPSITGQGAMRFSCRLSIRHVTCARSTSDSGHSLTHSSFYQLTIDGLK